MIRFILVQVGRHRTAVLRLRQLTDGVRDQNRQGKTRLSKWYVPYDDEEKVRWFPTTCKTNPQSNDVGRGCDRCG